MSVDTEAPRPGRPQKFVDHPGRTAAQAEIHARPIEPMGAPSRVRRVALLLGQDPKAGSRVLGPFAAWCHDAGLPLPADGDRHHGYEVGTRRVIWEQHAEFVTFTWISDARDMEAWPAGIGLDAYATEMVMVAVRVDIIDAATIGDPALVGFDPLRLCYSKIEAGAAEIATDFVADADGYT